MPWCRVVVGEDLKKFYRAFCEVIFGADITPNNVVVKVRPCHNLAFVLRTVGTRTFIRHNTGMAVAMSCLAHC